MFGEQISKEDGYAEEVKQTSLTEEMGDTSTVVQKKIKKSPN